MMGQSSRKKTSPPLFFVASSSYCFKNGIKVSEVQRLLQRHMSKFELCVGAAAPCLGSQRGLCMAGWILRLALQVVGKGTHGRKESRPESALLGSG